MRQATGAFSIAQTVEERLNSQAVAVSPYWPVASEGSGRRRSHRAGVLRSDLERFFLNLGELLLSPFLQEALDLRRACWSQAVSKHAGGAQKHKTDWAEQISRRQA